MNGHRFAILIAAAVSLLAVGTINAQENCATPACRIVVHISDTGVVTFTPDFLKAQPGFGRVITWQIDPMLPSKWMFARDTPVRIKDDDATERQFTNGTMLNMRRGFRYLNKNSVVGEFHYSVTVTDGTQTIVSPDPTIANQGKAIKAGGSYVK